MKLKPWKGVPEHYEILAIYNGTKGGIDTFLEFWQQCTGTIDVKAIEGTPAKADEKRGNSPVTYAILIDRDDLPFYYFVRWFQKEKEWTLYYLERDKEKREQWEHRIYCPWEYELEGTVEHEQRGILAMDERFYPLKEKEEFRNLFELLDVRPTLGRPGNPVKNINITNPPIEEREPFDLNIRLVSKTGISQNAQIDLKRIDEKIEDLEELKLIIEFQKEQSAKLVRLKIYPETKVDETGSSRELKQWFKRAPDEQLQRYCHTRIVAELGGKEQALHLVFPKGMGEEPRTSLPPSRYTLHLDNYWSKKGHNLFTPRNLCVYPSPPVPNTRIDEIIAGCLFKGITKKELLVLMRHGEEDYRFAIKPTCLEPPKYRTLSTLYPLEFFTAHKIMTRRNDKFYLDMDRYKTLTGEEKKELLKKCSTSQIETLARDFRYNGKLWKPRRKNKDPKYNEALSDHLYRGILAAITEEAEYPLLSEQVELLNARVLLKELITNSRADRQDDINHILEEVRKDMDAPAIKYIDTRRAELLKDIPARIAALKVAVNDTTSKINHLKQLIVTYKNWQKKWEGKLNILKKWRKWWEFSKEVLAIDRQINPHKNIKSMLENLDEIRRQISTPPKYSTGQINQHKLNAAAATLEKMAKDLRGE